MINYGINWPQHLEKAKDPRNYHFGAVTNKTVIKEDGNYLGAHLTFCIQKTKRVDLMNCLSQGAAKTIEVALEYKFGIVKKVSPRFIAKMSNTTKDGNDMFSVGDAVRKYGFVWEEDWPYEEDMTWDEYYATPTADVMKKAKDNWKKFDITYEIIGTDDKQLDVVMPYGMPAVIGHAWELGGDGLYYSYNLPPNHCFNKASKQNPDASKPCFDSYPKDYQIDGDYPKEEFIKVLAPAYRIAFGMLYYINLRDPKDTLLNKLKTMIKNIWMWFETVGSPKGMRGYYVPTNDSGKPKGKQEIDFENPVQAIKILFKACWDAGMFKKTNWGEISQIKDDKFV